MSRVWETSCAKEGDLLVLLAIADSANDGGEAWPSIETLAAKARLNRRHVFRILKRLEDMGELEVVHASGHRNRYRILLTGDKTARVTKEHPCHLEHQRGDISDTKSVPNVTPAPLTVNEPSVEPSTTPLPPKNNGPDFDADFWPLYPKGRGSKADAKKLWNKLSAQDRRDAIASIPRFQAGRDWREGFHKAPEVWLRGRMWENPPEPSRANGAPDPDAYWMDLIEQGRRNFGGKTQ